MKSSRNSVAMDPCCRFWAMLIVLLLLPALNAHVSPGDGLDVGASWIGLEAADDEIVLSHPPGNHAVLYAKVESHEEELELDISFEGSIHVDGKKKELRHGKRRLSKGKAKVIRIQLPLNEDLLRAQRFSGRVSLVLHLKLQENKNDDEMHKHEVDSVALPIVWFHKEKKQGQRKLAAGKQQDTIHFYRQEVLRETYNAGNFQDLTLPVSLPDYTRALAGDLNKLKIGGISRITIDPSQIVLDRYTFAPPLGGDPPPFPLPDDIIPAGARKFCLVMDGVAYQDSSRVWKNFGEDRGRAGDYIPMSRGWVALGQGGAPLYSGFLDGDGCTPYIVSTPNSQVSVAFCPIYWNPFDKIKGFVSDLNLGDTWPDSMPLQVLFFDIEDAAVNYLEMDTADYIHTIFAAASNCMGRASGGMKDVQYEFQLKKDGDNSGTFTNYNAGGDARVQIKFSAAATSKFTICHEYAHAMNIAQLVPPLPLNPTGIDYSVENGEAEQHTLTSKEWNLAAAIEGFANFVSAAVWSDVFPGADGVFVAGGTTPQTNTAFPLDQFDRRFINNFDENNNVGQGVELDWSQFFWEWRTDQDGPQPPFLSKLVDIWYEAYVWPVNENFLHAFQNAADVFLDDNEFARMEELRIAAGILP